MLQKQYITLRKKLAVTAADFSENVKKPLHCKDFSIMVEGDGFEPSKSLTTDLQSAPFGHSGTPP